MTSENAAPGEMPGVEGIARALRPAVWARCDAAGVTDTSTGTGITIGDLSARRYSLEDARAILALFAPILAEKEREKAAALGLVQGHAAIIASLEARALAAEAALAGLRQSILDAEIQSDDDDKAQARLDRLVAAIRAEE